MESVNARVQAMREVGETHVLVSLCEIEDLNQAVAAFQADLYLKDDQIEQLTGMLDEVQNTCIMCTLI